jgi:outer membrane protein insertion porin family
LSYQPQTCKVFFHYCDALLKILLSLHKINIIKLKKIFFIALLLLVAGVPGAFAYQDNERDPVVWNLSIEGNEEFRSMVLKQVIATTHPNFFQKMFRRVSDFPFNETELRRDQVRLERFYQRRGYQNVQVSFEVEDRRKEWQKEIAFYINEGPPVRIATSEIIIDADEQTKEEIREDRDFIRAVERHDYREGRIHQQIRQPDVEGLFRETLENLGYAWPEVSVEHEIDEASNMAHIRILLRPNSKTFFSDFRIEGDISVPERILLRQTDIQEGDVYSRNQMQIAQRSIFNHHLFRFATITLPEQERDSTLTALIRVREYPKRTVEAAVGVGREEVVRGQVAWRHRNISGTGHRLGANLRGSFIEQRAGTDYLVPYIFNSRSSNVTSLFGVRRLEPAFELLQVGFNNSLIYQMQRNRTATLSYEFSFNEELSRDHGVELPDTVLNYQVSSFTISGYYSEGFGRGQRGWVIQPSAEFSGTFGEATYSFQKLNLDIRRFTPLTNSTTLAKRVNSGVIFSADDEDLPANIRFFTGGTNSVRGWSRQSLGPSVPSFNEDGRFNTYVPIGGRAAFSFNMELRQQLTGIIPNFGLAAFLDGGQVWRSIRTLEERPVQFGAGGGLRYQSPIGPVRIDIAYKLNPTDRDLLIFGGENFGSRMNRFGIHFSIGQAF